MANKENKDENEKKKTTEKVLNNKLEELRRWFDSLGDCV